jgi:cyclopropane fatty-acyl-phospholipid synthase-like methyltransferase
MEKLTLDKLPRRVLAKLDLQTAFMASRLIVAAERLDVFRLLNGKSLGASVIGRKTGIHRNFIGHFLNALVSLGLLKKKGVSYINSALADKFFVRERSIYWTRQYSLECVDEFERLTILEDILKSGRDYYGIIRKKRPSYIEAMKKDSNRARDFTYMLYYYHQPDARALAKYLDLKRYNSVLDVGGGSGVMSIALAKKNPHITACVLDIEPVCRVAQEIIKKEGLSRRIGTYVGDINRRLPHGYDVIMFCDVGTLDTDLLKRAYDSLPPGGMVVLEDRYFSKDRTEPLDRLLYCFTGHSFGLDTRDEMVARLKSAGFKAIKQQRIHKDVWMLKAKKP